MKYWQGQGKYQKELDIITAELIPSYGAADTEEGELCRGLNRFFYDLYNNGLCNLEVLKDVFEDFSEKILKLELSEDGRKYAEDIDSLLEFEDDRKNLSDDTIDYETCWTCNGYGEVDGETCDECCGSGEVEEDIMSEQEEHQEFKINPLIERLTKNERGATALSDDVLKHLISTVRVQKLLKEKGMEA